MQELEFHPAANIFPLMEGKEFADLVASIKKHGVQETIWLHEGKILDGRNRYRAAQKAGCACPTKQWNGECEDVVSFVVSRNIYRRQLEPSQAAMCAQRARKMFDEMARERLQIAGKQGRAKQLGGVDARPQAQAGKSRDQVGAAFGVSGRSVDRARIVLTQGAPEVIDAVESGKLALTTAAKIAELPKEDQQKLVKEPEKAHANLRKRMKDDESPVSGTAGKGVIIAHEAINCLIRIPKNDPLRKRGFQIVTDWIKANR